MVIIQYQNTLSFVLQHELFVMLRSSRHIAMIETKFWPAAIIGEEN